MPALLLVAHSPLAAALAQVASHAFPDCAARLRALDVSADWSIDQAEHAVKAAIEELGPADVLILTDVFGATPCNAALRAADGVHVRVVAGANVPMLWRTLCYADEPLDKLVAKAVDGLGQTGGQGRRRRDPGCDAGRRPAPAEPGAEPRITCSRARSRSAISWGCMPERRPN